jgi:hypothetical protein
MTITYLSIPLRSAGCEAVQAIPLDEVLSRGADGRGKLVFDSTTRLAREEEVIIARADWGFPCADWLWGAAMMPG